jgi:hypothetical protein
VNRMMENVSAGDGSTVNAVEMWVVNTDAQALSRSLAKNKLNIGSTTSRLVPRSLSLFIFSWLVTLGFESALGD